MNDPTTRARLDELAADLARHRSLTLDEARPIIKRATAEMVRGERMVRRVIVAAENYWKPWQRVHGPVPVKSAHRRRYSRG